MLKEVVRANFFGALKWTSRSHFKWEFDDDAMNMVSIWNDMSYSYSRWFRQCAELENDARLMTVKSCHKKKNHSRSPQRTAVAKFIEEWWNHRSARIFFKVMRWRWPRSRSKVLFSSNEDSHSFVKSKHLNNTDFIANVMRWEIISHQWQCCDSGKRVLQ